MSNAVAKYCVCVLGVPQANSSLLNQKLTLDGHCELVKIVWITEPHLIGVLVSPTKISFVLWPSSFDSAVKSTLKITVCLIEACRSAACVSSKFWPMAIRNAGQLNFGDHRCDSTSQSFQCEKQSLPSELSSTGRVEKKSNCRSQFRRS